MTRRQHHNQNHNHNHRHHNGTANNRRRNSNNSDNDDDDDEQHEFVVRVSGRFIVLMLTSCILLSFAVGRVAKFMLTSQERTAFQHYTTVMNGEQHEDYDPSTDGAV